MGSHFVKPWFFNTDQKDEAQKSRSSACISFVTGETLNAVTCKKLRSFWLSRCLQAKNTSILRSSWIMEEKAFMLPRTLSKVRCKGLTLGFVALLETRIYQDSQRQGPRLHLWSFKLLDVEMWLLSGRVFLYQSQSYISELRYYLLLVFYLRVTSKDKHSVGFQSCLRFKFWNLGYLL